MVNLFSLIIPSKFLVYFPFRVFFILSIFFPHVFQELIIIVVGLFYSSGTRLPYSSGVGSLYFPRTLVSISGQRVWTSSSFLSRLRWRGWGMLLFSLEMCCLNSSFCLISSSTLTASVWISWVICIGSNGPVELGSILLFDWQRYKNLYDSDLRSL